MTGVCMEHVRVCLLGLRGLLALPSQSLDETTRLCFGAIGDIIATPFVCNRRVLGSVHVEESPNTPNRAHRKQVVKPSP